MISNSPRFMEHRRGANVHRSVIVNRHRAVNLRNLRSRKFVPLRTPLSLRVLPVLPVLVALLALLVALLAPLALVVLLVALLLVLPGPCSTSMLCPLLIFLIMELVMLLLLIFRSSTPAQTFQLTFDRKPLGKQWEDPLGSGRIP